VNVKITYFLAKAEGIYKLFSDWPRSPSFGRPFIVLHTWKVCQL